MLADQCERPLLHLKSGAFLDPDLGPLAGAPERREHRGVGREADRIIAPMTGRDHAPVQIEDAGQLAAIEAGDQAPVPGVRERRDDAQALFAFGAGWCDRLSAATSLRSSATSRSSSAIP